MPESLFAPLLKKRLWRRCFPVNFVKFLRTLFLYRTPLVAASVRSKVYHKLSLFSLKRSVSQTFKSSSCKRVFPKCVYHWSNLLRWMFSIPRDNCKQYFLHKFIVTQRHGATAMLLRSFKQVFWKKSAFYVRYLHNNITMMPIANVQNKASSS